MRPVLIPVAWEQKWKSGTASRRVEVLTNDPSVDTMGHAVILSMVQKLHLSEDLSLSVIMVTMTPDHNILDSLEQRGNDF